MPFRRIAGFDRSGKPWVNPKLPQRLATPIMVHQREYARCRLKGLDHATSIEKARVREHKGMTKRQVQLYELDIARRTLGLRARQSYSPLRVKRR